MAVESKLMDVQDQKADIFVIGISAVSGGGKTAVAQKVSEILLGAVTIFFDDYDFDTVHPESYPKWLEEGANYNDWKTPKLSADLRKLKAGQPIVSPVDGLTVKPQRYVIFDAPLGYAHAETAVYIDFMVFLDTPLDIAMARRLLRGFSRISVDGSSSAIDSVKAEMTAYLDYGRLAYLEGNEQIKPTCDLILDGCLTVDHLAKAIVEAIRKQTT